MHGFLKLPGHYKQIIIIMETRPTSTDGSSGSGTARQGQSEERESNMRQKSHNLKVHNIRNINFHSKKQVGKHILMSILIILVVGVGFKLSKKSSTLTKEKEVIIEKYLHIKLDDDVYIQLPYSNHSIFKVKSVSEKPFPKLEINESQQFKRYVSGLGDQSELSYQLYLNWEKQDNLLFQAEYFYLNQKYDLDSPAEEKGMCIMAPFRNLMKDGAKGSWRMFLRSVNGQNYSNYRVYMIDDMSTDKSVETIQKQIYKYPRLANRLYIVQNSERMGALGNRDSVTRNFCNSGEIVVDIDGDDAIIGRQALNLFNRFYVKNPDAWFVYASFISVQGSSEGSGRQINIKSGAIKKGFCDKIPDTVHETNTYRTNINVWVTSELRSYLRDLYIKIPVTHFLERGTGRYYTFASDRFIMYALSELAGPKHTFFYREYVYFYYEPNFRALQKIGCRLENIFYCEFLSRVLTPLMPLQSLTSKVETIARYAVPKQILAYYITFQIRYNTCLEKQAEIDDYFL